jgi:hypothetical protein
MPIHGDPEEHVVLAKLTIMANDDAEALMFAHAQLDELNTVKEISLPDDAELPRPPSAPGA